MALATGEVLVGAWLGPWRLAAAAATYCGVVGLRPSPGRVTRGTVSNLFSPLSVQGPMARTVADLALFLDTMTGLCLHDPLTFDAPGVSFSDAVSRPTPAAPDCMDARFRRPGAGGPGDAGSYAHGPCAGSRRWAARWTSTRRIWARSATRSWRCGPSNSWVDRELMLQTHRDQIKPDIIWNTERGLTQTTSRLAWAERERAAFFRRVAALFETYDLLVLPGAATPAFDVALRFPPVVWGGAGQLHCGLADHLRHHHDELPGGCPFPAGWTSLAGRSAADRGAAARGGPGAAGGLRCSSNWRGAPAVPIDPRSGTVPGA